MAKTFDKQRAGDWLRTPSLDDHKYTRGVLGVYAGSERYPGAAVLGVGAALRTGVGMVRYVGPRRCQDLVLGRYPAALVVDGNADAWVMGSGLPQIDAYDPSDPRTRWITNTLHHNEPAVLDAGALAFGALAKDRSSPTILTPHAGELARLLDAASAEVKKAPIDAATQTAHGTGAYVVLKGHTTTIAAPDGSVLQTTSPTTWLATGGTGDALAGILGALVTTHRHRAQNSADWLHILATGCTLHAQAAAIASAGGPITVVDLIDAIPKAFVTLSTQP